MRICCVIAALLFLSSPSFAASEKLLENCRYWRLAKDDAEKAVRVAACDRIIADKSTAPADLAEAYAVRANRAESEDRKTDALADYDQALALDPKQRRWRRDRAILLHFSGNHDRAIKDFDVILAEEPEGHMAFYRGLSYLEKGDEAQGFADLAEGIALAPDYYWYPYWRALQLAKRGRDDEALPSVDKAIALKGDELDPYILRSELYKKRGDTTAAIADLTRALEIKPDYTPTLGNRAFLYQQTGQYGLALADYEKLLTLQPGNEYYTQRKYDVMSKIMAAGPAPKPAALPSVKADAPAPKPAAPPSVKADAPAPEVKKQEPAVQARETDCRYYLAVSNTTISVPCPD